MTNLHMHLNATQFPENLSTLAQLSVASNLYICKWPIKTQYGTIVVIAQNGCADIANHTGAGH